MELCPEIWNVLHDATVIAVNGSVPGAVSLRIECDYLRKRFETGGEHFVLVLDSCTKFQFRPWEDNLPIVTNLDALGAAGLWILSADQREEHCQIHCQFDYGREGGGSLEVTANSASLQLDSGAPVSLTEIKAVAHSYWDEWSRRGPLVQQAKEIAKDILAGRTTPFDGAKAICKLQLDLATGDHALDGFVYWADEYGEADNEERRSYCERALLKVAQDLLDEKYPGGQNWDDNAPSVEV